MTPPPAQPNSEYRRLVEQETLIVDAQELICELLEKAGMNRQELARALGKSKGFVSQLLTGERNMTLRTLADLAFATGHRIDLVAVPEHTPRRYVSTPEGLTWSSSGPVAADQAYKMAFAPLRATGDSTGSVLVPNVHEEARRRLSRSTADRHASEAGKWIPA